MILFRLAQETLNFCLTSQVRQAVDLVSNHNATSSPLGGNYWPSWFEPISYKQCRLVYPLVVLCRLEARDRICTTSNSGGLASIKKEVLSITSLKKSPCFLSSASIALSRIPPTVALQDKQMVPLMLPKS